MTRFPLGRLALALSLFVPLTAAADGVRIRTDAGDPAATIFPSDRFTVRDWSNTTFRRVALPLPDCALRPSDCVDVAVINTLAGFSTQPRVSPCPSPATSIRPRRTAARCTCSTSATR